MPDSIKDKVPELMERLGISGHQLQNVRLGPGVVGRNSAIAWLLEIVMLAGVICGGYLHSTPIVLVSLIGGIGVALAIAFGNMRFGKENPAAALLEGAHFLQFHQMQVTARKGGEPVEIPSAPAVHPPAQLTGSEPGQLPESTESKR